MTPAPPVQPVAPVPPATPPSQRTGLGIASLVLGILSLCSSWVFICGGIFGVVAVVLGALGLNTKGRGMAIAGIIMGVVALLLTLLIRIFFRGAFFNNYWQQFLNNQGF
jgi:hypothetical protein